MSTLFGRRINNLTINLVIQRQKNKEDNESSDKEIEECESKDKERRDKKSTNIDKNEDIILERDAFYNREGQ